MNYDKISSEINNSNVKLFCLDTVDSTSSFLRRLLDSGEKQSCVALAAAQTQGRGRNGKSFYSPDGKGLYMSVLIHPSVSISEIRGVTARTCLLVSEVIEAVTGIVTDIKWVNDIYFNGKKVCGILCEAVNDYNAMKTDALIIGVGINLYPTRLPQDIAQLAGSLELSEDCFDELAIYLARALLSISMGGLNDNEAEEYRRKSLVIGKEIVYLLNGEKRTAFAVDTDSDGGLVVKEKDGNLTTLTSGEISVRFV